MDLLERSEFFEQLQDTLSEVLRGQGRLVLVSGEAGIGKTSLVEQFVAKQKNECRVLWGSCDALFTPRPLGPIYDIARQIRGDLLTLLEEEASRPAIFSAVFDELESDPATLLIIEDAHWADEATLDLLKFIGRRINKLNSLLVVTYRDDEVRANHPLRLILGDLPRQSVRRLRLPPLSEVAVEQLAERAGKRIEDLHVITGGNPFFITEALASNDPGVPVNVSDAVLSRVGRLSAEARAVVELVSVVPAKTELWLLDDTIKPATAVLEECLNAGMLLLDKDLIAFRHELARRAVEDSLPVPRAQRLHALVLKLVVETRTRKATAANSASRGEVPRCRRRSEICADRGATSCRPERTSGIGFALPNGVAISRPSLGGTKSRPARMLLLRVLCDRTNQRRLGSTAASTRSVAATR